MKKIKKHFFRLLIFAGIMYVLLFIVFWFDLDGKLLFHKVEPMLKKYYDGMERRDPLERIYSTDTPNYEYPER